MDARAIGAFRILLACLLLVDQLSRLGDWHAFHSVAGVLTLEASRAIESDWAWSLYWLSNAPFLPVVLEAARLAATLALLLGVRSRVAAAVLFILLASVIARNPILTQGGDKVLLVMLFFGAFLPLGARYSIEVLWHGREAVAPVRSGATVAYTVQVLLVWFMAGILKTGEQWWGHGTAISTALHLEVFATEMARLWRDLDGVTQALTFFVFWIECLAPLLVLSRREGVRNVGLLLLIGLEAGIWLSLEVGLFPWISLVSLVPLLRGRAGERPEAAGSAEATQRKVILFYDEPCRFCLFACRLLVAAAGLRNAELRPAQSDPEAATRIREAFQWTARMEGTGAGARHEDRSGWGAVLLVAEASSRQWIRRLLPGEARGAKLYGWIAAHRGALGRAGRLCFGRTRPLSTRPGAPARLFVSVALAYVLAWNVVSYPLVREHRDLTALVEPAVTLLGLKQYWSMFAPYPYDGDEFHVFAALTRDGRTEQLLSGEPIGTEPPVDGPEHYRTYRWRKMVFGNDRDHHVPKVMQYFCRAGRHAVIDTWKLSRPNLGSHRTTEQPYEARHLGTQVCGDADAVAVSAFLSDVTARIRPGSGPVVTAGRPG